MASVTLGIVGGSLGPIGAFIGAAIGGVIDQLFLFPALFPAPNQRVEGPRIQDLRLQGASFGQPINLCFGPEVPCAGEVIFMSNLKETVIEEESGGGGKGGGGGSITSTTYSYAVDCAIAVCEGDIADVTKIWADGKLIFEKDNDKSVAGTDITIAYVEEGYWSPFPIPDGTFVVTEQRMKLTAPNGGSNLSQFVSGRDVVVAGSSNGANNGTFNCLEAYEEADGTEVLILENAAAVDVAASDSITLDQTIPDADQSIITDMTLYKGTETQTPDPMIEGYKGVGEVPGFRGLAYISFTDLQLAEFGNRLPNFTFLVKEATTRTVKSALSKILQRAGLPTSEFDVSSIDAGLEITGLQAAGPIATARLVQTIMMAFDLTAFERDGQLVFVERGTQDTISVATDDLAAHAYGNRIPPELQVDDAVGYDLPRKVTVSFVNPRHDYQQDTAEYQRVQKATPEAAWTTGIDSDIEVTLPLTMTAGEAKKLSKKVLWTMWRERQTASISLPPSYYHVEPGDVVSEASFSVRTGKVTRGALDHLVEISGALIAATDIDFSADEAGDDADGGDGGDGVYHPPAMTFLPLDIPALRDVDAVVPGYYWAACATDIEATFQGATVHHTTDGGTSYSQIVGGLNEATICSAVTALVDGPIGYWDRVNTVDVRCKHGAPSAAAELAVLNGANRMVLGGEIIAWQDVTSLGDNTYRLGTLLRGLRDTHRFASTHTIGELGAVLLSSSIVFREENSSICGQARSWKCVATGGVLADVTAVGPATLQCLTLRPFAPAHFSASRDGSNDITYVWDRVTRSLARLFMEGQEVPLLPSSEAYEVDVYDSTDGSFTGSIVRTISVTAETAAYSAANQTSDGLTPGTAYDVRVYQIGTLIGRGNPAEGTL